MSVVLHICLADRRLKEEQADKVLVPISEGTLTIIDERAPSLQLLTAGAVKLLDSQNRILKGWFINGGVAQIAENICTIATEKLVDLDTINLSEIKEKAVNDDFYNQVLHYLKTFGNNPDLS